MSNQSFRPFSLRLPHRLFEVERPLVMGILNVTPDSFYDASRADTEALIRINVNNMLAEGADIIDIGACSTRPGATSVDATEELRRLETGLRVIREIDAEVPVSVDTFRAEVARAAVSSLGADIINDISGGDLDPEMPATVAQLGVPYIIMHMRGTPATMASLTDYPRGVTAEVAEALSRKIVALHDAGIADIIADPGLGFAKTVEQNYRLLHDTALLCRLLETPLLIGLSRKSMLWRPLALEPADVLPATIAANTLALAGGASVIRVHDVATAVQARRIVELTLTSDTH